MNKDRLIKRYTQRIIFAMILIALICFLYILFKGIFWTPSLEKKLLKDITIESTTLKRDGNKRYWISHLSKKQMSQLDGLKQWVSSVSNCNRQLFDLISQENIKQYCAVRADTINEGIILRYLKSPPPKLNNKTPWIGGFIDPSSGDLYDLLGRKYLN